MKCVCCEKEMPAQYYPAQNSRHLANDLYYQCCGYEYHRLCVYFKGYIFGQECEFITRQDNGNTSIAYIVLIGDHGFKTKYFNWKYPFNFKNKEKQIQQIEKMMVFI